MIKFQRVENGHVTDEIAIRHLRTISVDGGTVYGKEDPDGDWRKIADLMPQDNTWTTPSVKSITGRNSGWTGFVFFSDEDIFIEADEVTIPLGISIKQ